MTDEELKALLFEQHQLRGESYRLHMELIRVAKKLEEFGMHLRGSTDKLTLFKTPLGTVGTEAVFTFQWAEISEVERVPQLLADYLKTVDRLKELDRLIPVNRG